MASPFELVSQNLIKLGAIPVSEYLASLQPLQIQVQAQKPQPIPDLSEGSKMDVDLDEEDENVNELDMTVVETGIEQDEDLLAIERVCEGHCAHPYWVSYRPLDPDIAVQWGAALRVYLPIPQYYATDQIYATQKDAKSACARFAISEGVLKAVGDLPSSSKGATTVQEPSEPMSLCEWFEKLPRPLPSFFDDKVLREIHGAVTLDAWAGKARGARFKMHYYFPTRGQEPQRLYGCVLRIHRPKECRSFFVDPVFSKRFDAKTAVCLLAISRGVEDYFSSVATEIANIITPTLRAFANEQILPFLNQTVPGDTCTYSYPMDRNAFSCTLTVGAGPEETEYATEAEFNNKADARIAVLLIAAKNGLIEFVNYGHTPADFQARWAGIEVQVSSMPITFTTPTKRKREAPKPQPIPVMKESKKSKKQRKQAQAAAMKQGEAAALHIKDVTSRIAQPSSGMPSEKALGKRPVAPISMPMPIYSGGGQAPSPFAPPTYLQQPPAVQVPVPHFQLPRQTGQWPIPIPMWGNAKANQDSMYLQSSYPDNPHTPPRRDQSGHFSAYIPVDPSHQQRQHEFYRRESDGYSRGGPW